jgi:Fe-S cluster assembly protein SufD
VASGRLVRNNFECRLQGEGAELTLLNLAILEEAEQAHNYVRVHHEAQNCKSFEHYKNILSGHAVSSVDTTVTVHPHAQLAVSEQLVNNLMFSPTARADTKPRLMIHADDVKCKHGATVGRIDEAQIFYLMSRGLSEKTAKALIISGFAKGVLNAVPRGPMAEDAEKLLLNKLGENKIGRQ